MRLKISAVALSAMLGLACVAGCAPQDVPLAATGDEEAAVQLPEEVKARNAEMAEELASWSAVPDDQKPLVKEEIEKTRNQISERALENLPLAVTRTDGTKIQRTPATPDNTMTLNFTYDYEGWNTIYLNAENRGCNSCHSDLGELVATMGGEPHTPLSNAMGIDIQPRQCMDCHSYCNVLYDRGDTFPSIMHSIHSASNEEFVADGGDCMSCHYVESTGSYDQNKPDQGKFMFWDDVKYDLWRGLTKVGSDDVNGTFQFDQTYTLGADKLFNKNFFSDITGPARKLTDHLELTPNPEADNIYNTWEITFSGDISNPVTMTIQEMIDKFGLDTDTMTLHCDAGPVGTNLIGNYEIKGISMKKIMEYVGAGDDITIVKAYSGGGSHMYNSPTSLIDQYDGYLVLEVGGEPLPYQGGYPVQLWVGGGSAWNNEKQVTEVEFCAADLNDKEQFPDWFFNTGLFDEAGHSNYKPSVGVFNLTDGQVIDYAEGQPITFEGYASAFEVPISAVEFSFDGGETWVSNDTPNTTPKNWVHWQYDWTPPEQGAYVLMVRATGADGITTMEPLRFLLNVQDPENPTDMVATVAKAAAASQQS